MTYAYIFPLFLLFSSYLFRNFEPISFAATEVIANASAEFGDIVNNTSVCLERTIFWFSPIVIIFK